MNSNERSLLSLALPFIEDQCVNRVDGLTRRELIAQIREALQSSAEPRAECEHPDGDQEVHCNDWECVSWCKLCGAFKEDGKWQLPVNRGAEPT